MIIDSHQHVFWWHRDDAGLVADLDEHNIDLAWLLTWHIPPTETSKDPLYSVLNPLRVGPDGTHAGITLEDCLKCRDKYPDRFVVGYCPQPLLDNAPELFEAAYKMYGVRVCGEWKFRTLLDDPRCINLYRKAGELGCPVVLHLDVPYLKGANGERQYDDMWYGGTLANLERALIACPDTIFIGHAPGFWREISGDAQDDPELYPTGPVIPGGKLISLFETYPNLQADLSAGSALTALSRDPEHAKRFFNQFADRLLFGRDHYGGELQDFLVTLDLPEDISNKIYYENAQRLVHS